MAVGGQAQNTFEIEILWKVQDAINSGVHRISVLDSSINQWSSFGLDLASWFHNYPERVLIVCESEAITKRCDTFIDNSEWDNVDTILIKSLSKDMLKNYKYVIILDVPVPGRDKFIETFKTYEGFTISCGKPYSKLEVSDDSRECAFIFATKRIVDVRDAVCAAGDEKKELRSVCASEIEKLSADLENLQINSRFDGIDFGNEFCKPEKAKLKVCEDPFYKCDVVIKKDNSQSNDVPEIEYQKAKHQIEFYKQILVELGFDIEEIETVNKDFESYREAIAPELSSSDSEIRERASKKFQDLYADSILKITKGRKLLSAPRCEDYLIRCLTKSIWEKQLSMESRRFLLTAKVNFDSMDCNDEGMDYSGVCLLVTKALEVEVSRRFFHLYVDYLQEQKIEQRSWPKALFKDKEHPTESEIITEKDFMLGSVDHIVGVKALFDQNGKIYRFTDSKKWLKTQFLEFAKEKLYRTGYNAEKKLMRDIKFIDTVRLDYRNPAAHKEGISLTTAKDCFEYVVSIEQMLRVMLNDMKEIE